MLSGCRASDMTHKFQVSHSFYSCIPYFCITLRVSLIETLGIKELCFLWSPFLLKFMEELIREINEKRAFLAVKRVERFMTTVFIQRWMKKRQERNPIVEGALLNEVFGLHPLDSTEPLKNSRGFPWYCFPLDSSLSCNMEGVLSKRWKDRYRNYCDVLDEE